MNCSTDYFSSIFMKIPHVFEKIFNYLTFKDKLNCYEACESWSQLIDQLNNECLIIKEEYVHDIDFDIWFDDQFKGEYKFISTQNQILINDVNKNFLRSSIQLFTNNPLQQLVINGINRTIIRNILAIFNQIEKLSIKLNDDYYDENDLFISLPNLKVLSFEQLNCYGGFLINSSNLKYLNLNSAPFRKFEFLFPESIEYFKSEFYWSFTQQFTNLKLLYCEKLSAVDELDENLLKRLSKLEIIHTIHKRLYDEFQIQKIKFNLDQLEIYYNGLDMNEIKELELNSSNLQHQKYINRKLIEYSLFEKEINYSTIKKIYSRCNPFDWKTKCPNLNKINFDEFIQDEDQLINFFDEVKSINSLEFEILFVSSNLFQSLFNIRPLLSELKLVSKNEPYSDDQMRISFHFKNLTNLTIDQMISIEFVVESYSKFHRLMYFEFHFKNRKIQLISENQAIKVFIDGDYEDAMSLEDVFQLLYGLNELEEDNLNEHEEGEE